jgi:hypothetical protein
MIPGTSWQGGDHGDLSAADLQDRNGTARV